ncbi:TadE family protein [Actinoplanes siamensis]|uniref:TadE-like domain-containing protein n=1 Tax=Actinoplanes siamensis TaxID=1223317 RepID=A0A919N5E5_9ACTN|nr:TadE family protein [Actinoplanes siamensis]GIF04649.1 hypothetical protein Asi03nite_21870 [Actinoplanes siamensis]
MTAVRTRRAERPSKTAVGTVGWLRARWRRAAARPDEGAATAELTVGMPLLLFMIMMIFQAGVWMHATHVAQAAASRAANTAAAYQSSAGAGQGAGSDALTAIGSGVLRNPSVSVTRTATEVRVEVRGRAATVVPGMSWGVRAVVVRPVERWVTDPGAGAS